MHRFVLSADQFSERQRAIVAEEISFYNKLTPKEQRVFEHRVLRFIRYHTFVGREELLVTERMELLISATAIMITFGFNRYLLSKFETILVYPEHYFSNITQEYHKGEANPSYKTIVFSWEDFQEGIKVEDDNLNLGIHELTHALHFSFLTERSYSASQFLKHYKLLLLSLRNKDAQKRLIEMEYLREYAFENQYEFLSVLIEHFFETPEEFRSKLPTIYHRVKLMLNMDVAGF
ncbi:zinc-dependent peptidase [Kordia sp. YSTF-M3]|uniref:Zinc-dependent peptidase n=1 Tax=Kordia aestuariivivens TaxID=2759037 RepID=A0ABR7Q501_9FLAO|nr:zinc-dependent peptidase [Kordia aestuariivivens]MBC8753424.1 zinc-dependent peptidase [Kordia aestuariivivens]